MQNKCLDEHVLLMYTQESTRESHLKLSGSKQLECQSYSGDWKKAVKLFRAASWVKSSVKALQA